MNTKVALANLTYAHPRIANLHRADLEVLVNSISAEDIARYRVAHPTREVAYLGHVAGRAVILKRLDTAMPRIEWEDNPRLARDYEAKNALVG